MCLCEERCREEMLQTKIICGQIRQRIKYNLNVEIKYNI